MEIKERGRMEEKARAFHRKVKYDRVIHQGGGGIPSKRRSRRDPNPHGQQKWVLPELTTTTGSKHTTAHAQVIR